MSPEKEYVLCDLCGADEPAPLLDARRLPDGRPGGVVRCRRCRLIYRNWRPASGVIRREHERWDYSGMDDGWIEQRKKIFRRQVDEFDPYRRLNRILDVGSGHGFFLALCRERGWECHGVEPSPDACRYAERVAGLCLSQATFEELDFPDASFDIVTFWNTLDELVSPRKALVKTARLLRPGGLVVARFPNAAFHIPARRLFDGWRKRFPEAALFRQPVVHLFSFGRATIMHLMRRTGFANIRVFNASLVWTTGHDAKVRFGRRMVAAGIGVLAECLRGLTLNRWCVAPSLVVQATRRDERKESD